MYNMKKVCLVIFITAAIFTYTLADDDEEYDDRHDHDDHVPCKSDYDCEWDDCCATVPGTTIKLCKDKPDDYGQPCGGPFLCGTCGDGLKCIPAANGSSPNWFSAKGRCGRGRKSGRPAYYERFFG